MTYEYVCTACGHGWEAEQPISADPLKICPNCQAASAKRLVSGGAGFILKGGGWYADLYGSVKPGSKKEDSGAAGKDAKTESGGATKKTEPSSGSTGSSGSGSTPAGGSSPSGGSGSTASGAGTASAA